MTKTIKHAFLRIFTDGAYSSSEEAGGWGIVVLDFSDFGYEEHTYSGAADETTNNRMELTAVLKALSFTRKYLDNKEPKELAVQINSDSAYCINGASTWMKGWCAKGWKTGSGDPVKNVDIWKQIYKEVLTLVADGVDITWNLVKGHSGVRYNEQADKLAVEARKDIANS